MHLADHAHSNFEIIKDDMMQVHACTLSNGLKLFFSVNKDEPRIATEIAVRAGSKHDPAASTGLAHYFEHMMFKGTDKIGTLDWKAEKILLDQIEELYELHRQTTDPDKKRELYRQIDEVSTAAAQYATANEYDKLVGAMGAKGTNAYTWVEQTVYINDIPSNELERWFKIESERFRRPILRLFHTELETVFEEFNISQDKDFRKVSKAMLETLLPTHPYGTQTTLGKGEHLKSPSQKDIYRFFNEHYIPNNMAIALCGDFDPHQAAALAEKYFGHYKAKPRPVFSFEPQKQPTQRIEKTVYGEEAGWVELAWQLPGAGHPDLAALTLISLILYNEVAGLIDSNLVQSQKLLSAYAYLRTHEDYSMLILYGKPREGQSLQEVEQLLLDQMTQIQEGHFEDWQLAGAVRLMQLEDLKRLKSNQNRASAIIMMFVLGRPWSEMVDFIKSLTKVTKQQVIATAKSWFNTHNYVAIKKVQGKDTSVMKVEKPAITPIQVNRDEISDYAKEILAEQTPEILPVWPDFAEIIKTKKLKAGIKVHCVQEEKYKLGTLEWIWPVGKLYDPRLPLLQSYLNYLGTDSLSGKEIKQKLFSLGVHLEMHISDQRTFIRLSGLDSCLAEAVALLTDMIHHIVPNDEVLENLKADVRTSRENNRLNKDYILRNGMKPFAVYGLEMMKRTVIPAKLLDQITGAELIALFKEVTAFQHEIHYHGPRKPQQIITLLRKHYTAATTTLNKPPKTKMVREVAMPKNKVIFVHFPMVQVEMLQVSKGTPRMNKEEYLSERWFNNYFGTSMSSVVFQEIRESRAMAYQTYAMSAAPLHKKCAHYFYTFVGTQPDKMAEALTVMSNLVENMPINADLIEQARQNTIKVLNANRMPLSSAYWRRTANEQAGWKDEPLKNVLEYTKQASQADLVAYHETYIKGRKSTWLILGDRKTIDFKSLRKIGKVQELKIEDVLGY
jgi:predicted Zn-dependent peptidase